MHCLISIGMDELLEICKTWLNDADLDIAIAPSSSTIILDFVVGVSLRNVVFRCGRYTRLRVAKHQDDDDGFWIGETKIELITSEKAIRQIYVEDGWQSIGNTTISPIFRVRCDGSIMLDIVCGTLEWKIDDSQFQPIALPKLDP
jgi:hypothetical protein